MASSEAQVSETKQNFKTNNALSLHIITPQMWRLVLYKKPCIGNVN